ncbi:hypothetical protein DLE01_29530, partial [Streptomyces sp. FT05W]
RAAAARPCSALDPISTLAIEDLIGELKERFTIVIVTHNMQHGPPRPPASSPRSARWGSTPAGCAR